MHGMETRRDPGLSNTGQHGDDDAEMSEEMKMNLRRERKRMWRKNLDEERLSRLRERDASRKRAVRQSMSEEERRAVRARETARRAELRREKKMGERSGRGVTARREESSAAAREKKKDTDERMEDNFRKIPVESMLN